ncbi:MAG: sugar kinase [Lentisphaerae bacterium]|nr:sugar kinase [Lentisphaerota bacterium]
MMERESENKIVLITRRTRFDDLVRRFNTEGQARFYIERLGADFSDYKAEHETYWRVAREAEAVLARHGRLQVVERAYIPNFLFGDHDTVVALGQDGLVANVLKYLNAQPVLGVNPDPRRWEGVLLPFTVSDLPNVIREVFAGRRPIREVTMAKASLNTGQCLYGVNDLFIGPKTHTSARYLIEIGDRKESHSSSGVIVSTGLGSTGWLRSILAGATGIAGSVSGTAVAVRQQEPAAWDSESLTFSVREPWPSKTSDAGITFGTITGNRPLRLRSLMPENGVVFSDGIEADFLEFNSGTTAVVSVAEKRGHLAM